MTNNEINELWKPIPGFDGYEVSDQGRVRSSLWQIGRRRQHLGIIWSPKIMSPKTDRYGYHSVGLRQNGRKVFRTVHRLVLEAFVGPCPPEMEACHWDGAKTNNTLANLRWGTRLENSADSIRLGVLIGHKAGEKHHGAKLWDDAIRVIRAEPPFHGVNKMLAKAFGVSVVQICDIRAGRQWGHVEQFL